MNDLADLGSVKVYDFTVKLLMYAEDIVIVSDSFDGVQNIIILYIFIATYGILMLIWIHQRF